jgi:hypothetical protein
MNPSEIIKKIIDEVISRENIDQENINKFKNLYNENLDEHSMKDMVNAIINNNNQLGSILKLYCYSYKNTNFLKLSKIISIFESLKNGNTKVPDTNRKLLYNYFVYDQKIRNKDQKFICNDYTKEKEKEKRKQLKGYRPVDIYELLNIQSQNNTNEQNDIKIGMFYVNKKRYYAAVRDQNYDENIVSEIGTFNVKNNNLFTSYINFISDIFDIDWDLSIKSIIIYNCSFKEIITGSSGSADVKVDINKYKKINLITIKKSCITIIIHDSPDLLPYIYKNKIYLPKLKMGHLLYFENLSFYNNMGPYIFYKNLLPDIENLKYALDIKLIDNMFYSYWEDQIGKNLEKNNEFISENWRDTLIEIHKIIYCPKDFIIRKLNEEITNNTLNFYFVIIGAIFSSMSVIQVIQGFVYR